MDLILFLDFVMIEGAILKFDLEWNDCSIYTPNLHARHNISGQDVCPRIGNHEPIFLLCIFMGSK